ncbi:hypothetical protein DZC78_04750 [Olleya aquimaris]|uniref:Uncharacterized protein n=1 Tax=Olleya sediminilitoris TaxID=2795739 RepID=A0ABS1WJZ7_9FLAO|nr:hypothetical protein [Olleya sediminilitoris]AXO79723.1 hypothetical protein DZC78_04750 [Olleya aquimaris]MBL7559443.1 hypothetical protein [Olleya sediminilitoris]
MKTILKLALVAVLFTTFSCRDTKKEEALVKDAETIENIEIATDSVNDVLEAQAQDLQNDLDELEQLENVE